MVQPKAARDYSDSETRAWVPLSAQLFRWRRICWRLVGLPKKYKPPTGVPRPSCSMRRELHRAVVRRRGDRSWFGGGSRGGDFRAWSGAWGGFRWFWDGPRCWSLSLAPRASVWLGVLQRSGRPGPFGLRLGSSLRREPPASLELRSAFRLRPPDHRSFRLYSRKPHIRGNRRRLRRSQQARPDPQSQESYRDGRE